jgi:hypothetical protein
MNNDYISNIFRSRKFSCKSKSLSIFLILEKIVWNKIANTRNYNIHTTSVYDKAVFIIFIKD